jgi:CP12 domain
VVKIAWVVLALLAQAPKFPTIPYFIMSNLQQTVEPKQDLLEKIEEERNQARAVCDSDPNSSECAVAWDVVEELQAEAAHQKQTKKPKNSLERYCDDNPGADECRLYED